MSSGSKIRVLPEDVANKIAAGEVVERPASVVKELMENALDAGATRIDVTITAGGRRLVSVSDNGSGMGRDDALLAPERQATSKLRTAEDLARIGTMGFRGEALPSIASVSRFTLRTRRAEDDAGTEVEIVGGRTVAVRDCGAPPGTTVEVRDLFFNGPARRACLRSYATEQAHVRGMFLVHAIAWPAVAFSLVCDGDPVHRLRPAASLRERLDDLFGAGCVGLVKAADRYQPERGLRFSTYAVPVILGEIRRLFRENGSVSVGRTLRERALRAVRESERFQRENGRPARIEELAQRLGTDVSSAAQALAAAAPAVSLTAAEGGELDLPVDFPEEEISERLALCEIIRKLPADEARLLKLRYFERKTQSETAKILHTTQVGISRKEKKLLLKMREMLSEESEHETDHRRKTAEI